MISRRSSDMKFQFVKIGLARALLAVAILLAGIAPPATPAFATTEHATAGAQFGSGMVSRPASVETVAGPRFIYDVTDVAADGHIRWHEHYHNLVTTAGKNDLLDKYFKGSTYT